MLAEVCGPELTQKLLLPAVLGLANDSVPNVRFNVARSLSVMVTILEATCIHQQVRVTVTS